MKKVFILFMLLTMLLTLLAGCQSSGTDITVPSDDSTKPVDPNVLSLEPLSQELCEEINAVFLENWDINGDLTSYPEYYNGYWYYGTVNGCIVIFGEAQLTAERSLTVADYVFSYPMWFNIYVYKDGECCYLEEAYDKGWLTNEHIAQLHERHGEIAAEIDQAYDAWLQSQKEAQGG